MHWFKEYTEMRNGPQVVGEPRLSPTSYESQRVMIRHLMKLKGTRLYKENLTVYGNPVMAALLDVSVMTLLRWRKDGVIRNTHHNDRPVYYFQKAIDELLKHKLHNKNGNKTLSKQDGQ